MREAGILFLSERWERIHGILEERGRVTVEELADTLAVSLSTVRPDLRQMQRQGLLARARGGAVRLPQVSFDRTLLEARELNVEQKEQIGRLAASLVEDGDTVMLDAGSTTYHVARFLNAMGITVITNALDIAVLLMPRPNVELILIGGMVTAYGGSAVGPMAVSALSSLRADKAIIGINAISPTDGLSTPRPLVAEVKRAMIAHSREVIVVADHSKFRGGALCHVAPISAVKTLVTDTAVTETDEATLAKAGVQVLVAGRDRPGLPRGKAGPAQGEESNPTADPGKGGDAEDGSARSKMDGIARRTSF